MQNSQANSNDFLDIDLDGIDGRGEIAEYLAQPLEKVHDPVAWWWERREALNFLSIPGVFSIISFLLVIYSSRLFILARSTAVERLFSQRRQLLHFTRSHLSGNTICTLLCYGDWCWKDLVDIDDIVKAIRDARIGQAQKCGADDE